MPTKQTKTHPARTPIAHPEEREEVPSLMEYDSSDDEASLRPVTGKAVPSKAAKGAKSAKAAKAAKAAKSAGKASAGKAGKGKGARAATDVGEKPGKRKRAADEGEEEEEEEEVDSEGDNEGADARALSAKKTPKTKKSKKAAGAGEGGGGGSALGAGSGGASQKARSGKKRSGPGGEADGAEAARALVVYQPLVQALSLGLDADGQERSPSARNTGVVRLWSHLQGEVASKYPGGKIPCVLSGDVSRYSADRLGNPATMKVVNRDADGHGNPRGVLARVLEIAFLNQLTATAKVSKVFGVPTVGMSALLAVRAVRSVQDPLVSKQCVMDESRLLKDGMETIWSFQTDACRPERLGGHMQCFLDAMATDEEAALASLPSSEAREAAENALLLHSKKVNAKADKRLSGAVKSAGGK